MLYQVQLKYWRTFIAAFELELQAEADRCDSKWRQGMNKYLDQFDFKSNVTNTAVDGRSREPPTWDQVVYIWYIRVRSCTLQFAHRAGDFSLILLICSCMKNKPFIQMPLAYNYPKLCEILHPHSLLWLLPWPLTCSWYPTCNNSFALIFSATQNAHPGDAQGSSFSQVVWAASKDIGCAVGRCGPDYLYVCAYDPPGNVLGSDGKLDFVQMDKNVSPADAGKASGARSDG